MKIYRLTRDRNHACTLHVIDNRRTRLPMLVTSDQYPAWPMLTVATTLLLEYFDGEEQPELKARLLARALVHHLNRLGEEWELNEAELNDAVMTILVVGKQTVTDAADAICIEYLGGQRRDTLRLEGR